VASLSVDRAKQAPPLMVTLQYVKDGTPGASRSDYIQVTGIMRIGP